VNGTLHELDVLSSPSKTNIYASFDITLTASEIGCARHPFTSPPPTTNQLYFANSCYANELQPLLASPSSSQTPLCFAAGAATYAGLPPR